MINGSLELAVSCPGAELKEGKRFPADASAEELKAWAEGFVKEKKTDRLINIDP